MLYRKARQKARKIIEMSRRLSIKIPEEKQEEEKQKNNTKWIFFGVLGVFLPLFGLLWYILREGESSLGKLKVFYGEILWGDIKEKGREIPIPLGKFQSFFSEKTSAFQLGSSFFQMAPQSELLLRLEETFSLEVILQKGGLYFSYATLSLSLPKKGLSLHFQKATGWVFFKENGVEIGLWQGKGQEGARAFTPKKRYFWQRQWQERDWKWPSWLLALPEFPEIRPVQRKISLEKEPQVTSPKSRQFYRPPPYPYTAPSWKEKLKKKLQQISIQTKKVSLSSLPALFAPHNLLVTVDPSLLSSEISENLSKPISGKDLLNLFARKLRGQVVYLSPTEIFLAPLEYSPPLSQGEKVQLVFSHLRSVLSLPTFFDLSPHLGKTVSLQMSKVPFEKVLKALQKFYPPGLYTDRPKKKKLLLSVSWDFLPLSQVLAFLEQNTQTKYAPLLPGGKLCFTSPERAEKLWREYRRVEKIQREILPMELYWREQMLRFLVKLPERRWHLPALFEEVQKQTGVSVFLDQRLWHSRKEIPLAGQISLKELFQKVQKTHPHRVFAITSSLFQALADPPYRQVEVPEGLYVFSP